MGSILRTYQLGFPWQTQDPYLFCVYHLDHYPKGTENMGPEPSLIQNRPLGNDFDPNQKWRMYHGHTVPGFPAHPHRGFETITIVNKGFCDHADSLGAAARFGEGDVQWMTAGRGVQHSEMFPLLRTDNENPLELFQIWLNLPKKDKFVDPHFKIFWHEDIPIVKTANAKIKIIAGSYEGHTAVTPPPNSWAANADNGVLILNMELTENSSFILPSAMSETNRSLYFYEGSEISVEGQQLKKGYGVDLNPLNQLTIKTGSQTAKLLLLQGKPIDEPIAQQGPFVMNDNSELQKAFQEYRLTQFGGWPWPYPDHVHEKERGRFAKYPDGKLVEK